MVKKLRQISMLDTSIGCQRFAEWTGTGWGRAKHQCTNRTLFNSQIVVPTFWAELHSLAEFISMLRTIVYTFNLILIDDVICPAISNPCFITLQMRTIYYTNTIDQNFDWSFKVLIENFLNWLSFISRCYMDYKFHFCLVKWNTSSTLNQFLPLSGNVLRSSFEQ